MKLKYSTEEIIKKFRTIHGDKYDYSKFEYLGNRNKSIIICKIHGEFLQHSNSHLSGQGCRKCFTDKNTLNFISSGWKFNIDKRAKNFIEDCKIKSPTLDYSKTIYTGKKNKVTVICPIHGEYQTKPRLLLNGVSCKKCYNENFRERWSKQGWINYCDSINLEIAIFYILQFDKEEESFIKFGITSKDLKIRIGKFPSIYKITILKEISDTPDKIWNLEKYIKNKYKHFKYKPFIKFGGSVIECLNIQSLNKILNDKTVCCN